MTAEREAVASFHGIDPKRSARGQADVDPALQYAEPAKKRLPLIDVRQWSGDPPPRVSLWGDWLPMFQTTMLTGPGGVGKSLFEQVLLTHIALGIPFLGMKVERAHVLYVTCEDDPDELWRRQYAICKALNIPVPDIRGRMSLCSLVGESQTALATFDDSGRIKPTDRWGELVETCDANKVGIYAFDNATDAMAGDLNDIHQVAEFVNLLTGLALRRGGAAMIIHHPNKAGEDWLGSVAWHNKVRSRLIIEAPGEDEDSDVRLIRNPKANYGPSGGRIRFRWHHGTFVREEDLPEDLIERLHNTAQATSDNAIFLASLAERTRQGRTVSENTGPNYAPAIFSKMPESKGIGKKRLAEAMDRLFRTGAIEHASLGRDTRAGRDKHGLRIVE